MDRALSISRGILTLVGAIALLGSIGGLTGGERSSGLLVGPVVGLAVLGAAAWTTAPGRLQAVVVWLGVSAVVIGSLV